MDQMASSLSQTRADREVGLLFLSLLLALSIQFPSFSVAQIGHLWGVAVFGILLMTGRVKASAFEFAVFAVFILVALINTYMSDYDRIKAAQQAFKFALVYPAFYLVGRYFGSYYVDRRLPFGITMILVFLVAQWLAQYLHVPFIYEELTFQRDAIHGTFKERNWFAVFFFFVSYALFLKRRSDVSSALIFLGLGVVLTILSGSKSILVVVGAALMLNHRGHLGFKLVALVLGGMVFLEMFASQLSGEMLRVRLEDERGLAFVLSARLVAQDWLGFGFGFVEAHFGNWWVAVQGLGYGVNSVFSTPLDLILIAGPFGVLLWLVFFAGFGINWRAVLILAPIAAWSLINPLHQSEIVYLMIGYLVAFAKPEPASSPSAAYADSPQVSSRNTTAHLGVSS